MYLAGEDSEVLGRNGLHLGEGLNPGFLALSRLLGLNPMSVIQDSMRKAVDMSNSTSFTWH